MSSHSLQRWLTENLIRRANLVAVETLLRDGPILPGDLRQITRGRAYVQQLRANPRLQPVRDVYACLRRNPTAILTLEDGTTIAPRRVWKQVRRHLYAMPSEVFGMLSDHPQIDWITAHLRAGEMLEEAAETATEAPQIERLYAQAAAFYGVAAVWVREETRAGHLQVRDLDPATRRKLATLGKYAPWLQGRISAARTASEAEEMRQNHDIRRRHEQNNLLMPAFLRQFFQGGESR